MKPMKQFTMYSSDNVKEEFLKKVGVLDRILLESQQENVIATVDRVRTMIIELRQARKEIRLQT